MSDPIPLYWWDKKPNFGDALGPWLVEMMTGRPTINVRGTPQEPGQTALATVGSLIQTLDRPGLSLWGTGAIGRLSGRAIERLRDRRPPQIHAVRGAKTRWELSHRLGWEDVPRVYGDPGLLLPRYYAPHDSHDVGGRTALVLHYSHRRLLEGLDLGDIHDVDVRADPASVADQIASSSVCISSSLHGIVLAQAYEVPWIWLRITDANLLGGDFKFQDYFTVLEADKARTVTVDPARMSRRVIEDVARFANLPRMKRSLQPLLDSFPYDRIR